MKIDPRVQDTSWDVAIVGAGIGGLTVGALLARAGARVLVCEQHTRVGGYSHAWSRSVRLRGQRVTFTFDAAVHEISGAFPNGPVQTILAWLGLSEQLEWRRLSHEYCLPSVTFSVDEDIHSYVAKLKTHFPDEAEGIDQLFLIFQKSFDELSRNAALTGGLPRAPLNSTEMRQFRENCPTISKFFGIPFVQVRDSLLRAPELRQLLSILSVYITDDVRQLSFGNMLPLFGYYFRGGYYPRGGSQSLSDALARAITSAGGFISLRTPVNRIETRNRKAEGLVVGENTSIRAGMVISNVDPLQTFGQLVDKASLLEGNAPPVSFQPSNSAFLVYLGLDVEPRVSNSTFVINQDQGIIISKPPFEEQRVPEGYSSITLTGLISASEFKQWDRASLDYRRQKAEVGDQLLAFAARRIPDIHQHIVFREEGSPATLQRFTCTTNGAAYGSTFPTRWRSNRTPIRGLYLVGAATGLGPGVEAVMIGAASLAQQLTGSTNSIGTFEKCGLRNG